MNDKNVKRTVIMTHINPIHVSMCSDTGTLTSDRHSIYIYAHQPNFDFDRIDNFDRVDFDHVANTKVPCV